MSEFSAPLENEGSPARPEGPIAFEVQEADAGRRIDALLAVSVPEVGRKLAALLCKSQAVRVNGRPVQKSYLVSLGDQIHVTFPLPGRALAAPDLSLTVVFESPLLVICEKPAGVPSAAIPGREGETMAGALLARYPEMATVGYGKQEPGLLHRLDNDTSGLLMAARTQEAFLELKQTLSDGRLTKRYLALVPPGRLNDSGIINARLNHDPGNKKRVVVVAEGGKDASTAYSVLRRASSCDLVELTVSAAFRHQIRVHLAHVGAPLLGDVLYGGPPVLGLSRHALHASYIAGTDATVGPFEATSALPDDLALVLDARV